MMENLETLMNYFSSFDEIENQSQEEFNDTCEVCEKIIPSNFSKLLATTIESDDESDMMEQFLQHASLKLLHLISLNINTSDSLIILFSKNQNVYSKGQFCIKFSSVVSFCMSNGAVSLINSLDFTKFDKISKFVAINLVLNAFLEHEMTDDSTKVELLVLTTKFSNIFVKYIQNSKSILTKYHTQQLVSLLFSVNEPQIVENLFLHCLSLLKSQFIRDNEFALNTFAALSLSFSGKDFYQKLIKDKSLYNTLFGLVTYQKYLSLLELNLPKIIIKNTIQMSDIDILFGHIQSEKSIDNYCNLFAQALKASNDGFSQLQNYFEKLSTQSHMKALSILIHYLYVEDNISNILDLIGLLIQNCSNDKKLFEIIIEFKNKHNNPEFLHDLFKESQNIILNEQNTEQQVVTFCVLHQVCNISLKENQDKILLSLINNIPQIKTKSDIIMQSIDSIFSEEENISINNQQIDVLLKYNIFLLQKIIEKFGIKAINDQTFDYLSKCLLTVEKSEEILILISKFIILSSQKGKFSKEHFDLLLKSLLEANNLGIKIEYLIYNILINFEQQQELMEMIVNYYNDLVFKDDENTKKILNLFIYLIKNFDVSFSLSHHKGKLSTGQFPFTVYVYEKGNFTFYVKENETINSFKSKMSEFFNCPKSDNSIKFNYKGSTLSVKGIIKIKDLVEKNKKLQATIREDKRKFVPKYSFTEILVSQKFIKKSLEQMNDSKLNEDTKTVIEDFLGILPTDNEIKKIIFEDFAEIMDYEGYEQKYVFEAITMYLSRNQIKNPEEIEEFSEIWQKLKENEISEENKISALQIFEQIVPLDDTFVIDLDYIMSKLTTDDKQEKCQFLRILQNIIKKYPEDFGLILSTEPIILSEYVLKYDSEILENMNLENLQNKKFLFPILIKTVKNLDNAKSPVLILEILNSLIDESCDITELLDFCNEKFDKIEFTKVICQILDKIFQFHPNLISKTKRNIDKIFDLFIKECSAEEDNFALGVLSKSMSDLTLKSQIEKKLSNLFDFELNTFNFSPFNQNNRQNEEYCGLVNHKCNCWLNTILQEIYCNENYKKLIIETKSDKEWHQQLQLLLTEMKYTKNKFVDPLPFIRTFKLHETHDIKVGNQEDAEEFYTSLVDQLNSIGISNKEFMIQTKTDVMYKLEFNVDIPFDENLKKIGKTVLTAPNTLIIQIMRWTFANSEIVKKNTVFDFPQKCDISIVMDDNSSQVYELKSVVMHIGTQEYGHYYNLIRKSDKWIMISDDLIENLTENEAYSYINGYNDENELSYLLFYEKVDSVKSEVIKYDENVVKSIKEKNELMSKLSIAFSPSIVSLMMKVTDEKLLFTYLVNVVMHGCAVDTTLSLFSHIRTVFSTSPATAVKIFVENKEKIVKFLTSVSHSQLIKNMISTVLESCQKVQPIDAYPLLSEAVSLLNDISIDTIETVLIDFISSWLDNNDQMTEFCCEIDLFNEITKILTKFFSNLMIRFDVDISKFIDLMSFNIKFISKEIILEFIKTMPVFIENSKNKVSFSSLMIECCAEGYLSYNELCQRILNHRKTTNNLMSDYFITFLQGCNDETEISEFIDKFTENIPNGICWYIVYLKENICSDEILRSIVCDFPHETVVKYLCNNSRIVRCYAEEIIYSLFSDFEKPRFCAERFVAAETEKVTSPTTMTSPSTNSADIFDKTIYNLLVSQTKNIPKEAGRAPLHFTNLIRISSWIFNFSNMKSKFAEALWGLFESQMSLQTNPNCNILQLLYSFIDLKPKSEFIRKSVKENGMKIFNSIFPMTFERDNRLQSEIFFTFFDLLKDDLKTDVTFLSKIVQSNNFKTSVLDAFLHSERKDFSVFLSIFNHENVRDEMQPLLSPLLRCDEPIFVSNICSYFNFDDFSEMKSQTAVEVFLILYKKGLVTESLVIRIISIEDDEEIKVDLSKDNFDLSNCSNFVSIKESSVAWQKIDGFCQNVISSIYESFEKAKGNGTFFRNFYQLICFVDLLGDEKEKEKSLNYFVENYQNKFEEKIDNFEDTFNLIVDDVQIDYFKLFSALINSFFENEFDFSKILIKIYPKVSERKTEVINMIHDVYLKNSSNDQRFITLKRLYELIQANPDMKPDVIEIFNLQEDDFASWDDKMIVYLEIFMKDE
ncbi:Clan CA, family C19, ubiquitin hydrolase-like cysteine peptidase [Trichomonas vaginalis G3]|uniref:Clan CA, family C19, ubiquitin hydrolase-like cysteine peptidase n=1 Tax=Trichomonas vaginalis (strain ATCC PRA-98 / G3) TaxID=412133 RepID=A2ETL7_TRIV3|nr:ubiquitinyl hydrolase protein [Trichomonas vaginalis G3]EAY03985.1 Clan CA, family C19, ubiquitin hydrolase-like cysteine peptidase [Trichomonas vaginalis G3]KAI5534899.1 ubiquitinyl hydrolase protein [Trichomonas vaginalis G3]|eukprot:XP_001316208.1 Clan CA, family C19, ubiquitin hydrolase-like cysteine peptidase [Trichomonas vaginalis G3]